MKKFILMTLLCVSSLAIAQNLKATPRTITVNGSTLNTSKEVVYKTKVILSMDNNYYADVPCTTLKELQEKYFGELKKQSLDISKFVEDELAYSTMGYRTNGIVYRFETKSKDDIVKVLGLKMSQVQTSYVKVKSLLTQGEIKTLTKAALKDARQNAEMVADVSGEKLGNIYSISGNYGPNEDWTALTSDEDYFRLTVVYTLLD